MVELTQVIPAPAPTTQLVQQPRVDALRSEREQDYAQLLRAYDMEHGHTRDALITALSLRMIVHDVRPDRADLTAIRYIVVDWEEDGLIPMRYLDGLGEEVTDTDDLDEVALWTSNISDPHAAGMTGRYDGPLTLDLHAVRPGPSAR
ncbi:hypothetical protein [Nocardia tengchongensis]|uniref:hypothetical protein n=1 Tax=Nocardia tengchongensis TaxID=2055889 RepID=UPI0036649247